jgi:hypothetical protein
VADFGDDLIEVGNDWLFLLAYLGVIGELQENPVQFLDILNHARQLAHTDLHLREFNGEKQAGERRRQIVGDASQHQAAFQPYAVPLSPRMGPRLFVFVCSWYDENSYYEFHLLHVVHNRRN